MTSVSIEAIVDFVEGDCITLGKYQIDPVGGMVFLIGVLDNLIDNLRPEGFTGQLLYRLPDQVIRRSESRPFTRHFVVTCLGYFPLTRNHLVERPLGLSEDVLIFVESGEGWVSAQGVRRMVKPGTVVWLPSDVPHSYGSSNQTGWSLFWFHFRGDVARELLAWTEFSTRGFIQVCGAREGIRRQFRQLFEALKFGYCDHSLLEMSRTLINVIALLHQNPPGDRQIGARERIERSMEQMRETLNSPRTLTEYAMDAGYSPARFCYWFKRFVGVSAMSYLKEIRTQRACELLDNTSLSIKEIGFKLGYDDPCYFSRAFSSCTGLSPSAYRSSRE